MCSINMYVNSLDFFAIKVPAQMRAFVDYEATFPLLDGTVSIGRTIQPGTNYKIVVFHKYCFCLINLMREGRVLVICASTENQSGGVIRTFRFIKPYKIYRTCHGCKYSC